MSSKFSSWSKGRKAADLSCIFVHAGAGFHSKENENHHLQACNDACKSGMAVMRAGGSAIDAVEIAIKILEDREITNAGYGSNLGYNGQVECDAIVVDHFGRSGAVGGVAQIRNPISLARLLLDHSTQSLSLRRVPPNLLVGPGATKFAAEHDMPIVAYDDMISPFAKHRWQKWRCDLLKAETVKRRSEAEQYGISPTTESIFRLGDEEEGHISPRRAHERAMLASCFNEAQPISPPPSDVPEEREADSAKTGKSSSMWSSPESVRTRDTTPDEHSEEYVDPFVPQAGQLRTAMGAAQQITPKSTYLPFGRSHGTTDGQKAASDSPEHDCRESAAAGNPLPDSNYVAPRSRSHDGSSGYGSDEANAAVTNIDMTDYFDNPTRRSRASTARSFSTVTSLQDAAAFPLPKTPDENSPSRFATSPSTVPPHAPAFAGDDLITDTVGAIAIDNYGNIACGASSGGIGMKHQGRVGPAGLIGIGAHVVPQDQDDDDKAMLATVTSGTGEHMSTTMAASVCSERLFSNTKKLKGGKLVNCNAEDEALLGFIQNDFMGHPSVKNSESSSAIGTLTVKKTKDGIWLYFGHNTDSFALASMHSDENKPVCTMSRSHGNGSIAQGGRSIRIRKKK